ncbi:putative cytoplasmic protein [Salmonella enterica subsp. enterica]|nr:putative cytoplasmic protein [Salmonella enterica subsp. enterica] [Salmonella enterica subsp. enterica serovar Menston]
METLSVIHTVANRLRALNPDMDIHISSTDAKVYIPTGQQVTVLIHYCGSVFTAPENTNATVQKQLIRISATVIVPQISDAINALDRLRRSLGGIELPDCDRPLWLESEKIYRRRRKLLPLRPGYDRQHPVYRGTGKQGLPPADNR